MIRFGQALAGARRRRFTAVPAAAREAMSLRGDPDFDPLTLSSAQQTRLTDMKSLITRGTDDNRDPYRIARRDCIWWYSHDLLTNIQAQLLAFRATGDLWFLDTIYELVDIMIYKREVAPGTDFRIDSKYRDTCSDAGGATEGEDDGYLKWVHRENPTCAQQGTDIRRDYDYATHYGTVLVAYALHHNRDLTSPEAHDYGALADWLLAYNIDHYEAKFRARNSKPTGFPIETYLASQTPRVIALMLWHYYMGLLRSDSAYTDEAVRMSGILEDEFCAATPPEGGALVWRRQTKAFDNHSYGDYLSPSTYGEHVISALMDAHFEGFGAWASDTPFEQLGRMVTEYMADNANPLVDGFADCVGGNVDRCTYSTWTSSHTRPTHFIWQNGMWGTLSSWDATGDIAGWNETARAYSETQAETNNTWDRTRILAAQFLHEHLGGGA